LVRRIKEIYAKIRNTAKVKSGRKKGALGVLSLEQDVICDFHLGYKRRIEEGASKKTCNS
jgi:hypothetical protein